MKHKSIKEIVEEIRDRDDRMQEEANRQHAENVRKRPLGECYDIIAQWKKSNFRKNSAKGAHISLLNYALPTGDGFQDFYRLQLFIQNNMDQEYNITHEAFDTLALGLEKVELPGGLDRYTYLRHEKKARR